MKKSCKIVQESLKSYRILDDRDDSLARFEESCTILSGLITILEDTGIEDSYKKEAYKIEIVIKMENLTGWKEIKFLTITIFFTE